jgi:CBS domain-containing protein
MRVEELMSREVYWCRPEEGMDRAAQLMWDRDVGVIPVCGGEDGRARVTGVITDRDIAMCALFRGKALHEMQIQEGMTRDPQVVRPGDSSSDAERIMRRAQVRRLPVVDEGGSLVGIVSLADLSRQAASASSSRTRDVSNSEIGNTLAAIVEPGRRSPAAGAVR